MKPHLWIDKLIFNNDYSLELEKNSITVFVGPNNAGKSAALKDINNLLNQKAISTQTIVKDINITIPFDKKTLLDYLEQFMSSDGQHYSTVGANIHKTNALLRSYYKSKGFK